MIEASPAAVDFSAERSDCNVHDGVMYPTSSVFEARTFGRYRYSHLTDSIVLSKHLGWWVGEAGKVLT